MIDLQKFCAADSYRTNINKPFSRGDFTYATNGHIMIRVPRIDSIGEQEISDKFKIIEPEKLFAAVKDHPFHLIPDIPPLITKECARCGGSGKLHICPECDGDGVVYFSNAYNDYTCDCETCGGDSYVNNDKSEPVICAKCDGSGKITEKSHSMASGRYYDNLYLTWLKELPNCMLAEADGLEAGYFSFTGGDGLIMPLQI